MPTGLGVPLRHGFSWTYTAHTSGEGDTTTTDRDDRGTAGREPAADRPPTLLAHMGGPTGFVHSTAPVVVFVTADPFLATPATITASSSPSARCGPGGR